LSVVAPRSPAISPLSLHDALPILLGLPLSLEDGAGSKSRKATRQLIATDDFWDMLPEEELAKLLGWRILLGVGFAQLEWTDHGRSEEHTSELQSRENLVCRLLLEK